MLKKLNRQFEYTFNFYRGGYFFVTVKIRIDRETARLIEEYEIDLVEAVKEHISRLKSP